jgi:predicted MFS family arabinose efflux permease
VNIGVLLACLTTFLMADLHPKWVFLVGVLPALMVFWIRRHVPEPEEWHAAKKAARGDEPGIGDLFRGTVRRTTLLTIIVCACGLTAWWAFMFWHAQHLRNLPELHAAKQAAYDTALQAGAFGEKIPDPAKWVAAAKQKVVSTAFFLVIFASIFGNFFVAAVAKRLGYRRSIALAYLGFFLAMFTTFIQPRGWEALVWIWFPLVGFFSGVFGLFTMYLPPLFPTLLRTTGAGFCYNVGRIASAAGVVFSGTLAKGGDFKRTLIFASLLFIPAFFVALILPEPKDDPES